MEDLPFGHEDAEDFDAGGFDCDRCGAYIPDTAAEQFAITTDDGIVCLKCKRELDAGAPFHAPDATGDSETRAVQLAESGPVCDWCRENGVLNCRHQGM